jgi:hypothetical protein
MYDRRGVLTVARLDFTDAGHPGLQVRVVRPGVAGKAAAVRAAGLFGSGHPDDVAVALADLAPHLADSIVSWTLARGGRVRVPSRREVGRLDEDLLLLILREWIDAWPALERAAAAPVEPVFDDAQLAEAPMLALVDDAEPGAEVA